MSIKVRYWMLDMRQCLAERDSVSQEKFQRDHTRRSAPIQLKQAGLTLIELVVYMGLMTIMLTVLTAMFGNILDAHLDAQSQSDVMIDDRFITARLAYDISRASSITTPSTAGVPGGSLTLTITGDPNSPYTYSLSGGNLVLTNGAGTNVVNGVNTTVSSLQFLRESGSNGKDTITTNFTLTSKIQRAKGAETKTIQITNGLR